MLPRDAGLETPRFQTPHGNRQKGWSEHSSCPDSLRKYLHSVILELISRLLQSRFSNHHDKNLINSPTTVTKDLADPSTTSLGNSRSICFETLVPERKCPYKHCKDFPLQVMLAGFWNSCIRKKRPLVSFAFGDNKIVNLGLRWLRGWQYVPPSLTIWVQALGPTGRRREGTPVSCPLTSTLPATCNAHSHACMSPPPALYTQIKAIKALFK